MLQFDPTDEIKQMSEMFSVQSLSPEDYPSYFQTYIDLVPTGDIRGLLRQQIEAVQSLLGQIDEPTSLMVHAPYTWTIRQVVGHLIDVERIFAGRAHRIACQDIQSLPGFDHDDFVNNTDYATVSLSMLSNELTQLRQSNAMMFERFSDSMWSQSGSCDGKNISVTAVACILVGHINHHSQIVENRIN